MKTVMEHEGTKYEHSKQNAGIDSRTPFTYCSLCNGWFPRGLDQHRGTTITELEEIVDTVIRCGSCGDATNNAEPFCNGPICFKRGD